MSKSPEVAVRPEVYEIGMDRRRAVMGETHVDRSWQRVEENPFLAPLQETITGLAWGAIWGRAGLELKTRSIITVSMLLALNRRHELAGHIRGAFNVGWTKEELREVILHAGIYCGMPAAIDGFRVLEEVIGTYED
jgi:4-carboxymuconolactone decarboxylase